MSSDGLDICETCLIGFYQNDYASTSCEQCPDGTTTWRRGTRTKDQCGGMVISLNNCTYICTVIVLKTLKALERYLETGVLSVIRNY